MIEIGISHHPAGKTFGLSNRIAGVFELLDMLGYWKDKQTKNLIMQDFGTVVIHFTLLTLTILSLMTNEQ